MWIRSQNNKILFNTNELYLGKDTYKDQSKYSIVTYSNDNSRILLGEYSSEEKALNVLLKIEDSIANNCSIFYMPEDKEHSTITEVNKNE